MARGWQHGKARGLAHAAAATRARGPCATAYACTAKIRAMDRRREKVAREEGQGAYAVQSASLIAAILAEEDEAPRRGARRLQNLTWQNKLDCETNGGEFAKQSTVSPGAALRGGRRARGPPRIHARISIERAEATAAGRSRRLGTTTPSLSTRRAVQRLVAGRVERAGPLTPERAIRP